MRLPFCVSGETMKNPSDDRPPMVVAAEWVSRITTIALEMALPGVLGLWIDKKAGTLPLFLVLGAVFGMTTGLIHLVRMTAPRRIEGDDRTPQSGGNKK